MKKLLILIACASMPAVLSAEQWKVLGTRPMGMGGAFVAVAEGPIAQYWNPGGLVKTEANVSGMEIPVGLTMEFTGDIVDNASQIGDLADQYSAMQTDQTNGTPINAEQIAAFTKTLSLMGDMNDPGKGAMVELAGGVNFKFSKLALSVNNYTSVGLSPFIDTTNIGLGSGTGLTGVFASGSNGSAVGFNATQNTADTAIQTAITTLGGFSVLEDMMCGTSAGCFNTLTSGQITDAATLSAAIINQAITDGLNDQAILDAANTMSAYAADAAPAITAAASGASYTNNTSNLTVAGASFIEIAAGYAWKKDKWVPGLSLGGNVKMINGRTVSQSFRFLAEDDTADAFDLDDPESSWAPSLDLGALWKVNERFPGIPFSPKVGLVIRNINSPKFDTAASGDYKLGRQARLGLALNPMKFWTLAMDLDLTKNDTPIDGFKSRQLALGTEINIINRKAFNIPLRAGILSNIAEDSSKMAYTLGTGINLLHMHFDVSGMISSNTTEIDGDEYPVHAGITASFGLLF